MGEFNLKEEITNTEKKILREISRDEPRITTIITLRSKLVYLSTGCDVAQENKDYALKLYRASRISKAKFFKNEWDEYINLKTKLIHTEDKKEKNEIISKLMEMGRKYDFNE